MLHRTVWDGLSVSSIKKLVLDQELEQDMLHRTVWGAPSAVRNRKLVLDQEQENYFITDRFIKDCERLASKRLATAVFVESRA